MYIFQLAISSIILAFIIFTLVAVLWWYLTIMRKYFKARRVPGPIPIPVIGNILNIGSSPQAILHNLLRMSKKYERIFKLYIGTELRIVINRPEDILPHPEKDERISERDGYKMLKPWIGKGLFTDYADSCIKRRPLLLSLFDEKRLDEFLQIFHNAGHIFLENLVWAQGPVEVTALVERLTLDTVNEAILGVNLNSQANKNIDLTDAVHEFKRISSKRTISSWKRLDCLFTFSNDYRVLTRSLQVLHRYTDKIIADARKHYTFLRNNSLIKALLQAEYKSIIDRHGVADEVTTFLLTGHDLSATVLSFALLSLAENPDVQEKVYREIISVDGCGTTTNIQLNSISKLTYLDRVIQESQRYYPTIPAIDRVFRKGHIAYDLPKDAVVTILVCALNQDPGLYPEPHKFNPDRFLNTNEFIRKIGGTFIPFGVESRCCPGQRYGLLQVKTILVKVVKFFHILPVSTFKPVLGIAPQLKSCNGIWLQFAKR